MILDIVIAALLVVTSGYCWRLNRRMSAFRNAKGELEQMIRSFDAAIRQAYESIAILKENSSDKNIQLLRDMEKVRFLANDLAYLVEKGEKLADELEANVRQPRFDFGPEPVGLKAARPQQTTPPSLPARQPVRSSAASAAARHQPMRPRQAEPAAPRLNEVQHMIDALARSYVTDPLADTAMRAQTPKLTGYSAQQPQPQRSPQQRTQAIEKMLNQLNRQPAMPPMQQRPQQAQAKPAQAAATAARAAAAPRQLPVKPAPAPAVAAASNGGRNRFFDSLRVVSPNE